MACLLALPAGRLLAGDDQPSPPRKPTTIRVSKETTYLTEPLNAEGLVDYHSALDEEFRKGVTPENNFVVVLWQTAGPLANHSKPPDRYFEKLGIDTPPDDGSYFINYYGMASRLRSENSQSGEAQVENFRTQHDRALDGPCSADE